MHILYVDDSGSVSDPTQRYFVLGAVSVFERGIYHLIQQADECIATFGFSDGADVELHATDMYGGRGQPWSSIKKRADRENLIHCSLATLTNASQSVRLFAVAVDKAAVSPRDAIEVAFEELCNRFNLFLQRIKNRTGEDNRGLIVMDESKHEKPLQNLARNFRVNGSRWGQFRHLAEVPFFVDSKATRLIQLADLVAWSTFRKYEFSDGRFFDPLLSRFDQDGGVLHGLYHARGSTLDSCFCP
ncbi:MAG TPA: DUF3800 domain-containing protein, partial [Tepidisphaeraceae bacterium]